MTFPTQEEEDIDMETVHDSQAFIYHHLNMLERPSTPGKTQKQPPAHFYLMHHTLHVLR